MKRIKQSTPRKLLRAAADAFAHGGFDATSTRTVADRAGVNIALIAYHFKNKDGLYEAVLDGWVSGLCASIEREISGVSAPSQRTDALVSVFLRYALIEAPGVAALIARESVTVVNSQVSKRTATALRPLLTLLDSILPTCETTVNQGESFLGLLLRLAAPMPSIDGDGAKGYHAARIRALTLLRPASAPFPQQTATTKPETSARPFPPAKRMVDFVD